MSEACPRPSGVFGLTKAAKAVAPGTSSRSNPSRFGARSAEMIVIPVALPPGRERLEARPNPTGSPPITNTIGIVDVALLATRGELTRPRPPAQPPAGEPDRLPIAASDPDALRRSDIRWKDPCPRQSLPLPDLFRTPQRS